MIIAASDPTEAGMDANQDFPPEVTSVTAARRFVADRLRERGDEGLIDTAALLTCELAQNAVRHAGTGFSVSILPDGDAVRIEVGDGGPAFPRLDAGRPRGGKGLVLVDALSDRWGVREDVGGGKVVWFELGPSAAG